MTTVGHLLWPLNEELHKFFFPDPSLSLGPCGASRWPWGPLQVLPVLEMFALPQGSGVWFQEVCRGPCMTQDLLRQADLDKFTPKGQYPGGLSGWKPLESGPLALGRLSSLSLGSQFPQL